MSKLSKQAKEILLNAVVDIETRAAKQAAGKATKTQKLKFDMSDWVELPRGESVYSLEKLYSNPLTNCGGSCCLFGDIALRNKKEIKALKLLPDPGEDDVYISNAVIALLGITENEAVKLYDANEWPSAFSEIYDLGESRGDQRLMAYALRRTVEDFIAKHS